MHQFSQPPTTHPLITTSRVSRKSDATLRSGSLLKLYIRAKQGPPQNTITLMHITLFRVTIRSPWPLLLEPISTPKQASLSYSFLTYLVSLVIPRKIQKWTSNGPRHCQIPKIPPDNSLYKDITTLRVPQPPIQYQIPTNSPRNNIELRSCKKDFSATEPIPGMRPAANKTSPPLCLNRTMHPLIGQLQDDITESRPTLKISQPK